MYLVNAQMKIFFSISFLIWFDLLDFTSGSSHTFFAGCQVHWYDLNPSLPPSFPHRTQEKPQRYLPVQWPWKGDAEPFHEIPHMDFTEEAFCPWCVTSWSRRYPSWMLRLHMMHRPTSQTWSDSSRLEAAAQLRSCRSHGQIRDKWAGKPLYLWVSRKDQWSWADLLIHTTQLSRVPRISSPFCATISRERAMSLHLAKVFTLVVYCLQQARGK